MYRFKLFYFTISLFFGLIFLFWWGITFWQNNNCRTITPDSTLHWTHFYTCEYNDEYNMERLANYCAKDWSTSTWPEYSGCPIAWKTPLKCHICECKDGIWINGVCKKEEAKATQDPELTWSNTISTTINWTNTENQQTEDTSNITPCPSNILNSQWNCCKKTYYDFKLKATVCCEWILLSTNVPFIWQCIVYRKSSDIQPAAWLVVDEDNAFPVLMGWLSKILVSIILLVSFVGILIGGVMISASWWSEEWANKGRKIIGNVISALALLWASGVILKLINPNFFW